MAPPPGGVVGAGAPAGGVGAVAPGARPGTWVNTLGMQFALIPAGRFDMGSDDHTAVLARNHPTMEPARLADLADERPRHSVQITRAFWMGRHEVTVGQFRRFLALSGHVPESVADGTGGYGWRADYDPARSARGDAFEGRDPRYGWFNPGFPQTDDHPVTNVTWNDAHAMARWLSQQEGARYRLPTEAEWEHACRAGQPSQDEAIGSPAALQGRANLFDQDSAALWPHWQQHAMPWRDGFAFTAPVGSFAPNAFGLHDMLGNVWEWVSDWYADDTYTQPPSKQVDPAGPDDGHVRVRRGGSWHSWALYTRCAYRNVNTAGTRYTLVGMRLVREAGP